MDGLAKPTFAPILDTFTSTSSLEDVLDRGPAPRSILIGEETLLIACADVLRDNGHEVVAIVAGRDPVANWARSGGMRLFASARELLAGDLGPIDYIFSITNLSVLPGEVLALANRAAINFHDGPLPAYAGLNTPVWALLAGEERHGVTWHLMTDAVDEGPILASENIDIDEHESAVSLNTKCFEAALRSFTLLAKDLPGAMRRAAPQAQAPERMFGRRDRPEAAGVIDWTHSAEEIARTVRALDFGSYRNPLVAPKAMVGDRPVVIQRAAVLSTSSGASPGTVIAAVPDCIVATGTTDLHVSGITDLDGTPIGANLLVAGARFDLLSPDERQTLSEMDAAAGRYERWWSKRLATRDALQLPQFRSPSPAGNGQRITQDRSLPEGWSGPDIFAAFTAYLARVADRDSIEIGYFDSAHAGRLDGVSDWFADQLPLRSRIDWTGTLEAHKDALLGEVGQMHKRIGIARDLIGRSPELRGKAGFGHPIVIRKVRSLDDMPGGDNDGAALSVAIADDGRACRWAFAPDRLAVQAADDLWLGFVALLAAARAEPDRPLGELSLFSPEERTRVVVEWNAETAPLPVASGMHALFAEQAARTPQRTAVTSRGVSLTYAELDASSNQLARHLAAMGVRPNSLVGIHLDRSVDVPVALLAVHKAGGAYVPLDPVYPRDRLAHMIADSGLTIVISQSSLRGELPPSAARILCIDVERAQFEVLSSEAFDGSAGPADLAYVIYTSGSTGKPKGVMIEHRNAINFFAGMDRKLEPDGTWLAVTSLSFDISVLELCWPLTRGYHVVIATDREVRGDVPARVADRPIDFSLFYFASSDDSTSNADQYRLLLDGARFGDTHGFSAIWTPERHFHEFGGPYPNPAVTSAAIAAVTSRIAIRAGSVVAPLHHPIRIAEEWALVDNLSNGRVGIAFASGWQPNDFVLNPGTFRDKQGALMRSIDDVRGLWRGETRSFPGPLGEVVAVSVFPRPVQAELPFWITTAGSASTFEAAGRIGASVLTHLLGQSVDELAEKIALYRRSRAEAGHAGDGHVTLMLHSFVGKNKAEVREIVRQPLIDYLRTSTNLLKQYAWSFPTFKRPPGSESADQLDLGSLSAEESDILLEHAFERYFETSGLFGTVGDCSAVVERLRALGVDEIGCLIDFGIATDTVLASLPLLNEVRQNAAGDAGSQEMGLPDLIARHGVTHLQCTPSLAQMLTTDDASRRSLGSLRRMMVGGEAFPPHLAQDLKALVGGPVMNMYGPTETTIWSTVHELTDADQAPPLGRPLANQQIYIVDRRFQPVRPGTPGELMIGGDGVVRGYHDRPELTAERFIADPVRNEGRAYRTGDLARQRPDGTLEFLGRLDHQVKIRGYRIELGEIEAALTGHAQVREAVVVAQEQSAATRLVAYVVAEGVVAPDPEIMREHLRAGLPDFMIPAAFVRLSALPRTPNGKVDRAALPAAEPQAVARPEQPIAEPASPMQEQVLEIWGDLLRIPNIGLSDNFFDLGGHSLLAVQLFRRLGPLAEHPLALTDIFRFPTVATLSAHLSGPSDQLSSAQEGQDRAQSRRAALQRRSASRVLLRN